jgi:hypothetical protein
MAMYGRTESDIEEEISMCAKTVIGGRDNLRAGQFDDVTLDLNGGRTGGRTNLIPHLRATFCGL